MSAKMEVKQIKKKVDSLKSERLTWETLWQEIADYMLPNKNTVISKRIPGEKKNLIIVDGTGVYSLELLAGQLHGLLTNPNAMWFEYTTGIPEIDKNDEVRAFLQQVARDTHTVLNNSNFQTEVHEMYLDEAGFGTAAMYIEEDDKDVVRFSTKFIAEYYIDEDSRGRVNQIYRCWKWNAYQIIEAFGKEAAPKKVLDAFEKNKEDKFEIIHAIYPQAMVTLNPVGAMKYVSQYVMPDLDFELEAGGYREFPYVVPRWSKGTGEKYGRSPAMTALPDVKMLNKMVETILRGAQKVVDPPVQLPDDGFILPIITKPGGINYKRSGSVDAKIEPIFNDSRIDFGFEALKEKRTRVREAFYIDQLMLQNQGPQMTATEVLQRTEEKMRLMGPMLGRQQAEFLRPLIDRVFAIMLRKGIIDRRKIPALLAGRNIDVKYSSLIAKAQRLTDAQNIMRAIQASAPFMQMDQSVADNFNGDEAVKTLADVFGVPQEIIRKKSEVDEMRQGRQQAQEQQAQAMQQQQQVDAMAKAAPAMQAMSAAAQGGGVA